MLHRKAIALAVACLVCALSAGATPPPARQLHFDVFLDDRPIGTQRFVLHSTPDGLRVETQAELALELLRVTVFAYSHRNVEEWRGGCLHSIDSLTDSNGTNFRVRGRAAGEGFLVASGEGERRIAECVGTFSYWDKQQLLQRSRLLNAQTGEYVPVEAHSLGPGRLAIGSRELPVERWELRGEELRITLAYSRATGEWVGLDSSVAGGRTLRYRRAERELREPDSAPSERF
jgi:hypothetical protein